MGGLPGVAAAAQAVMALQRRTVVGPVALAERHPGKAAPLNLESVAASWARIASAVCVPYGLPGLDVTPRLCDRPVRPAVPAEQSGTRADLSGKGLQILGRSRERLPIRVQRFGGWAVQSVRAVEQAKRTWVKRLLFRRA